MLVRDRLRSCSRESFRSVDTFVEVQHDRRSESWAMLHSDRSSGVRGRFRRTPAEANRPLPSFTTFRIGQSCSGCWRSRARTHGDMRSTRWHPLSSRSNRVHRQSGAFTEHSRSQNSLNSHPLILSYLVIQSYLPSVDRDFSLVIERRDRRRAAQSPAVSIDLFSSVDQRKHVVFSSFTAQPVHSSHALRCSSHDGSRLRAILRLSQNRSHHQRRRAIVDQTRHVPISHRSVFDLTHAILVVHAPTVFGSLQRAHGDSRDQSRRHELVLNRRSVPSDYQRLLGTHRHADAHGLLSFHGGHSHSRRESHQRHAHGEETLRYHADVAHALSTRVSVLR